MCSATCAVYWKANPSARTCTIEKRRHPDADPIFGAPRARLNGALRVALLFAPNARLFALARTRARQEVFVFSLHLFTGMPQIVVAECVRGEGFLFFGSRWGWWGSPR